MDNAELESLLTRVFQADLSVGTEAFRDELLVRCLDVLGADDGTAQSDATLLAFNGGRDLDDGELEFLAAAGDLDTIPPAPKLP